MVVESSLEIVRTGDDSGERAACQLDASGLGIEEALSNHVLFSLFSLHRLECRLDNSLTVTDFGGAA